MGRRPGPGKDVHGPSGVASVDIVEVGVIVRSRGGVAGDTALGEGNEMGKFEDCSKGLLTVWERWNLSSCVAHPNIDE